MGRWLKSSQGALTETSWDVSYGAWLLALVDVGSIAVGDYIGITLGQMG